MKRLFIFFAFALVSCSGDDDPTYYPPVNTETHDFNPPSWLIGLWLNSDSGANSGFRVKEHNLIATTVSGAYADYQALIDMQRTIDAESAYTDELVISDTEYHVQIYIGHVETDLHFVKLSPTTYKMMNGPLIFTKQAE